MPIKNREERRARRQRILKAAIRLAHELFPEDEGERKKWLVKTIAGRIDIPMINERTEEKILSAIIDLIEDLVD
tara:strand:+ start:15753 stop:15974 length:222 start_codon:yes stop_codon:yes gene_type:complete